MKTLAIFAAAVAALGVIVWLTAGRHQDKGPATQKLEALAEAAEKGDVPAMLEVARRYGFGIRGLSQNWSEARTWARKAAEAGSPEGRAALAAIEARGLGGVAEPGIGLKALKDESDAGNAEAAYALGYIEAFGPDASRRQAGLELIRKAAKAGFYRAQYRLGMLAFSGAPDFGIEKDSAEAMRVLELAAKQADPDACGELGRLYLERGSEFHDYQEAYAWLYTAKDSDPRWEPLRVEAKRRLTSWEERDYENAVTFSRREYGAKKFRGSLAAKAVETSSGI